ncbi:MAG TPA: thiamine S protein, partial [Firmicutes bacterium]|nr:thiamine S protein [Bacillota bacterium]
LETAITGTELANKLGISLADIEVIFVNGFVQSLAEKIVPGDRVAFVPPGCPG